MADPTTKDLLLAIAKLDTKISTQLNTLLTTGVTVDETAVLTAVAGVQATANLILAQDQPTPVNPPVLVSISPTSDTSAGGLTFTATGSNLLGTTGALVGTVAATNYTVINDTTATFTSSAQPAGVENVTLVGPGGTSAVVPAGVITITAVAPTTTTAAIHNISVADTSVSATGVGLFTPGAFTINDVSVSVNPNDSLATIAASTQAALQVANHVGASVSTADSPGNFNLTVIDPSTGAGSGFAGAAVAGLTILAPTFS